MNKFKNIESKDKKFNGKNKKAWVNIRKVQEQDDDDEPKSSLDIIKIPDVDEEPKSSLDI